MKGTVLRLALKNSILFKFIFRKSVISNGLNHVLHLTIAMVTIYTYLLHTHVLYVIFHVYYTKQNKKKSESQFKVFIREMGRSIRITLLIFGLIIVLIVILVIVVVLIRNQRSDVEDGKLGPSKYF